MTSYLTLIISKLFIANSFAVTHQEFEGPLNKIMKELLQKYPDESKHNDPSSKAHHLKVILESLHRSYDTDYKLSKTYSVNDFEIARNRVKNAQINPKNTQKLIEQSLILTSLKSTIASLNIPQKSAAVCPPKAPAHHPIKKPVEAIDHSFAEVAKHLPQATHHQDEIDQLLLSVIHKVWDFNEGWKRNRYNVPSTGERFVRYKITGDGDCAFHAINESRSSLIQEIEKRIGKDLTLQKLLDREILYEEKLKILQQNGDISKLDPKITPEERLNYVKKTLSRSENHLSFHPADPEGGTFRIAAYTFGRNINIWQDKDGKLELLTRFTYDPRGPKGPTLNLLHTKNTDRSGYNNHFDRLVDVEDLESRHDASIKELNWSEDKQKAPGVEAKIQKAFSEETPKIRSLLQQDQESILAEHRRKAQLEQEDAKTAQLLNEQFQMEEKARAAQLLKKQEQMEEDERLARKLQREAH